MDSSRDGAVAEGAATDAAATDAAPRREPEDRGADFRWIGGLMGGVFFPIAWLGVGPVIAAVATLGLLGFLWVLLRGR